MFNFRYKTNGNFVPAYCFGIIQEGVNIADAIFLLGNLFGGGAAPLCMDTADANDDGSVNIADAISILGHLFGGDGPLPAPFPSCGTDPTPDALPECEYPQDKC